MPKPSADLAPLAIFRQQVYAALDHRQDSLFDLIDGVLTTPEPTALVRFSLSPAFRRRWPSACDALADGPLDAEAPRALFARHMPPAAADERPVWVLDGTTWPRPAAVTSPERTYGQVSTKGTPSSTRVAVWAYQWLVALPELTAGGSWALPLDVARRGPTAPTPTQLAIQQLRTARARQPVGTPRPVAARDSGSHADELAAAHLDVDGVVRLAQHRVFEHPLAPSTGRGRPRVHGRPFRLKDPTTHEAPPRTATAEHPTYGTVTVTAWTDLRTAEHPTAPFTVLRVTVEHLPRHAAPQPLWVAWVGGPLPDELLQVWRWYLARFTVEHLFRFAKQTLGWTRPRLRHPAAADRWTWLLASAVWQLWLARPRVADHRLPWEHPLAPDQLTPGRVRRAFLGLLPEVGSPARAPHPRGKSPGRQRGQRPGPRPRFTAQKRTHPLAA